MKGALATLFEYLSSAGLARSEENVRLYGKMLSLTDGELALALALVTK